MAGDPRTEFRDGMRVTTDHMRHMQDRLREAVLDVRRTIGLGRIGWGLRATLDDRSVNVTPGIAFSPSGLRLSLDSAAAVSLPDGVFRAAERHARRARKSRSQLYAEALSEYLARHAPDEVTDAMNQALDQLPEGADSFVRAASLRILERSEW